MTQPEFNLIIITAIGVIILTLITAAVQLYIEIKEKKEKQEEQRRDMTKRSEIKEVKRQVILIYPKDNKRPKTRNYG